LSREPWKPLVREAQTPVYKLPLFPWPIFSFLGALSIWPPWCSRRLLLSQKCTARHSECDEQARIRNACYIVFPNE
jgi:hypothetical protein